MSATDEYARENKSYGLTTMRDRHAKFDGSPGTSSSFRGKSGRNRSSKSTSIDPIRARWCAHVSEHPRLSDLFQYTTKTTRTRRSDLISREVNDYMREISGPEVTAKDFRTWSGTVLAAVASPSSSFRL